MTPVSGHQPPRARAAQRGLAPSLPRLQQQLQPEHAAQPRQGGRGIVLIRVIESTLTSEAQSSAAPPIPLTPVPVFLETLSNNSGEQKSESRYIKTDENKMHHSLSLSDRK